MKLNNEELERRERLADEGKLKRCGWCGFPLEIGEECKDEFGDYCTTAKEAMMRKYHEGQINILNYGDSDSTL